MSISVALKFKPHWARKHKEEIINAVAGETVVVDCRAAGHPPPTVTVHKGMLLWLYKVMFVCINSYTMYSILSLNI